MDSVLTLMKTLFCGINSNHPAMGNADEPPGGSWNEWTKMPQVTKPGAARTLRRGRECNCLLYFIDLAYLNL